MKGLRTNREKILAFREACSRGEVSMVAPVREVAAKYGVSPATVSNYRKEIAISQPVECEHDFIMTPLRRFVMCSVWSEGA